jgi:excisionase family DNA binding protein
MPDIEEVISFTEAAKVKDCGRNTLYRAADDGRLNAVEVGGRRMIVQDEKWTSFQPNLIGHRARQQAHTPDEE